MFDRFSVVNRLIYVKINFSPLGERWNRIQLGVVPIRSGTITLIAN